jgi:hypothetical protein
MQQLRNDGRHFPKTPPRPSPRGRGGKLVLVCLIAIACSSCGPRMRHQISIKPYRQVMPVEPAGIVPTNGRLRTLTLQQSKLARNPIPPTKINMENGRIYYGYYCLMCHGKNGDGNGPVGESYVPKPTNLSSPTVSAMNDGRLYNAMLKGTGHDPVMVETVQTSRRWPLILYVRAFSKNAKP